MPDGSEIGYAVTPDGTHIAYRVAGSGPPDIVFIPPWMSTVELDINDPYVGPTLRRLSAIGRCVSYDKGGSGMSDALDRAVLPTLEQRVDELVAVMDAAGVDRPTILTGADGAAIAIAMAVHHPSRVAALCLYAPFARALRADDYPFGYEAHEVELIADFAASSWGSEGQAPTAPSKADDPQFLAWFARYQRRSASPAAGRQFLTGAMQTDVRDLLPRVHVPTVVLHRRGDQLVPVELGRYVADNIPGARLIELDGADHFWAASDAEPILDAVEELATGTPSAARTDRVLATVLFTDIVGSTERASRMGDRPWKDLLETHDRMVREELTRFGGREISTAGDGFLATFDLPSRALQCASSIQASLRVIDVQVRAGVHTGEIELRGDDISGIAVHIGARVAALAAGDEVLVSPALPPLVAGSGITFSDRGEHGLKGVSGTWRIWALDKRSI